MFSIVTANRNRLEHLQQAIPSWQECDRITEIIVVDYGSMREISAADFPASSKLIIATVRGTDQWRLGHAVNIGVDLARSENIVKLDSDQMIRDASWLDTIDLTNRFYRGNYRQGKVTNGEAVFKKADWEKVGGYNEWMSGYAFEDSDFYGRLRRANLAQAEIEARFLAEIPHSDAVRAASDTRRLYSVQKDNPTASLAFDAYKNLVIGLLRLWRGGDRMQYERRKLEDGRIEVVLSTWPDDYFRFDTVAQMISALRHVNPSDAGKIRDAIDDVFLRQLLKQFGGH